MSLKVDQGRRVSPGFGKSVVRRKGDDAEKHQHQKPLASKWGEGQPGLSLEKVLKKRRQWPQKENWAVEVGRKEHPRTKILKITSIDGPIGGGIRLDGVGHDRASGEKLLGGR